MARAVQRVVAGDHHGADAHRPQLVETLAHAVLDDVLEVDDAQNAASCPPAVNLGHDERGAAGGRDAVDDLAGLGRHVAALLADPRVTEPAAPLRICACR